MNKPVPDEIDEDPEEVGARHGDATGAWRILRNSSFVAIVVLAAAAAVVYVVL